MASPAPAQPENTPASPTPSPSASQLQAQTSFFNALIKNGYELSLKIQNVDWKTYQYKFVAESCALECREDNDKSSSKLISFISLRKFALSYSPVDPLRFSIKTPNRIYQVRTRDQALRNLWIGWLDSVSKDSHVMAEHAFRLAGSDKPLTLADKFRPPFWVPKSEADWCGACHKKFKAFSGSHTCRDCGYVYCSSEGCFTDGDVKRCNSCVTSYSNVGSDGSLKVNYNTDGTPRKTAPIPQFNPSASARSNTYFQDLNEDPLIKRAREKAAMEARKKERAQHQMVLGQDGLTTAGQAAKSASNSPTTSNGAGRSTDLRIRSDQMKKAQEQIFAVRETQRIDGMRRIASKSAFSDVIIFALVVFIVMYYFCLDHLKTGVDVLIKSL